MSSELAAWVGDAERWLEKHLERRPPATTEREWGEGSDSVALFKNLSHEEEAAHLEAVRDWHRLKCDAGYGSISWPEEFGGAGLSPAHEAAFARLEREFVTPDGHEAMGITLDLMAPTLRVLGDDRQKKRHLTAMRRTDELWCQLFSEPGAGSDLAGVATRAQRHDDGWELNGQKVWTSGAQFADYGLAICVTDPDAPKHHNLTAFIVPMDDPGVEVRPLRQMTGGAQFNEVFLTGVRLPDECRLGDVGAGWNVALTVLKFERTATTKTGVTTSELFNRLVMLAGHLGVNEDPIVRQRLAAVYIDGRVRSLTKRRVAATARRTGTPGPEGSIGKLAWTEGLRLISDVAASLLGPALTADSGDWGTYCWAELVNGAPGMRLAGGTDEIQRNVIAERVLGLPRQ